MLQNWNNQPAWRLEFVCEEDAKNGANGEFLSLRQLAVGASPVLCTGLGKKAELTCQRLRRAAAKAVKGAAGFGAEGVVLDVRAALPLAHAGLVALMQGAALGAIKPESFKTGPEKKKTTVYVDMACADETVMDAARMEAGILVDAVAFARDLTNRPANLCTPACMAATIAEEARKHGVDAQVLDEKEIDTLGMRAFLAVGASAANQPRLVVLRYNGAPKSNERIALVGKGITYDTGGYCIKPARGMDEMRGDMGGGAAAAAALIALARAGEKVNAVAVVPAAENRISADAYVPGDVVGSMAGKSIYVGNTDAEGRLLLADAVTYAIRNEGATRLVDVATLTGSCANFLGAVTTGLFSNNDALCAAVQRAAEKSGEKVWRLPLDEEYRDMIMTPVADVANVSKGGCGAIAAALFIAEFVEDIPWVHLDIAGTAWVNSPKLEYQAKGATGVPVETLYRLCTGLKEA